MLSTTIRFYPANLIEFFVFSIRLTWELNRPLQDAGVMSNDDAVGWVTAEAPGE
jgi:hypothetical protein